jgi:integrase/recombinase XerD
VSPSHAGPPAFARQLEAYLRYNRALGMRYRQVDGVLIQLGRHLEENGASDLNGELYESWRRGRETRHSNTRRKAEQIVRRFCLYRRRSEPDFFVPSADGFSRLRPYARPVIVEPEQIARMLSAADKLPASRNSPLHAAVGRIATVLLYTSGLRSGELLRLQIEDIEDASSVLRIRESKFHKSRLVPLSDSTQKEVRRYLEQRATFAIVPADRGPFLCNRSRRCGRPYSAPGFQSLMRRLFKAADVRDLEGRVPRVHDLRHSFAVQSLIRSYQNQGDPQALLPKLAMYLGHVSIESTMHYLKLVPALAALAMARFEAGFGNKILGDRP